MPTMFTSFRSLVRFHRSLRCDRGAAAVELALVAPIVGVLLLGFVDVAQRVAMRVALEQAANRAVELATSRPPTGDGDYEYLEQEAEAAVRETHNEADLDLDVDPELYMTCDGVFNENYAFTDCPGAIARFAAVSVTAKHTPIFDYGPLLRMAGIEGAGLADKPLAARSEVRLQ